jgi:Holliday junction DNA helicase RuvA
VIASVEGTLELRGAGWVVVKVGGISLRVQMSDFTLNELGAIGEKVRLHTHLHWKEDSIALYGFMYQQELDLFRLLITVNGVGPRSALAMLSRMQYERLASAIAGGDVDLLTELPGVGKKMASRLVVELKGKLEKEWVGVSPQLAEGTAELVAVLTGLGYSASEAARAAAQVPLSSGLSLEEKTRLALRHLAK